MRILLGLCLVVALLATALWMGRDALPPAYEPVDLTWREPNLPEIGGLSAWLAEREAQVPAVRGDAAKTIRWAGVAGERTPLSIVYVHGFSASAPEIRPVPDRVAAALGANLFFTRLTGHGRDGPAMAEPKISDWAEDLAEAVAIGRLIGERVIVIGSSMGGALSTLTALDPAYGEDVAGLALVAPAYRLHAPNRWVITLPYIRVWGPLLLGETREVDPRSPEHGKAWTLTYPFVSVLPLGALVKTIGKQDKSVASVPAIFFFSDSDQVVDPAAVREAAATWGAPATLVPLVMGPGDDVSAHVIAGDILSPGQTTRMVEALTAWASDL